MRASSLRRNAPAKAKEAQGAVAQARPVILDRREDLAQQDDRGGELGPCVDIPLRFQWIPFTLHWRAEMA